MEIQKLTNTQNEILEQLRLLAMDHAVVTQNMDTLEPVTTMQEFDTEEDNLKDQLNRKSKRPQIRQICGKDVRTTIKKALDRLMTRGLQFHFSKDGLKGALIDSNKPGYTKNAIISLETCFSRQSSKSQ